MSSGPAPNLSMMKSKHLFIMCELNSTDKLQSGVVKGLSSNDFLYYRDSDSHHMLMMDLGICTQKYPEVTDKLQSGVMKEFSGNDFLYYYRDILSFSNNIDTVTTQDEYKLMDKGSGIMSRRSSVVGHNSVVVASRKRRTVKFKPRATTYFCLRFLFCI